MRRTRLQQGSVILQKRANGEHVWIYRWWDKNRKYRGEIFATITQCRNKTEAWAEALRLELPEKHFGYRKKARSGKPTFGKLVQRFKQEAMPCRYSTKHGYKSWLDVHIVPRWEHCLIDEVEALEVEEWLTQLKLAPKSKGHVKGLMTILFNMAMKWKMFPLGRNPMELVRVQGGVRRKRKPAILSQAQFALLLDNIKHHYVRLVVIIGMCLGLRFSEALAIQWHDIDWQELTIIIRRGFVDGHVGDVKTEYSEAPAPLDPELAELLRAWKKQSVFTEPQDWLFASPFMDGKQPYFPTGVRKKIHAAAKNAGLSSLLKGEPTKILRHSYRSWLGTTDAPLAVIKDLMRHADIRTTMNHYGNAMPEPMREANSKVVQMALKTKIG